MKDNDTTNTILKIISIVILLAMGFCFGIMPFCLKSCRNSTKFLNISNAFSGGLFLGIGLFHVLPEGDEKIRDKWPKLPWAYFIAFSSYALILFVEKIFMNTHEQMHEHLKNLKEKNNDEGIEEIEQKIKSIDALTEEKNNDEDLIEKKNETDFHPDSSHSHEHHSFNLTPYILLFALGFHGLFEGIALGVQSEISGTLSLLLAIAAHKWAASLTLGISFVKAEVESKQFYLMISIFASIGPIGSILGLIITHMFTEEYIEGIFLAISTGTFIYVACSEVLVEEFEKKDNKKLKFLAFMFGGIFISGLSVLEAYGGIGEED